MIPVERLLAGAEAHRSRTGRPLVTLSFAQSLDGSIAVRRGEQMVLSSPEALHLTHLLRSRHDAILVGIGTILADDPRLTVRLCNGAQPQPVILDSQLRLPLTARVLNHPRLAWVAANASADIERRHELEKQGAQIMPLPVDSRGRISLMALLDSLGARGINSLMVEGGSAVITSFLVEHLVDRILVTIAPYLVGGLRAIENPLSDFSSKLDGFPALVKTGVEWLGRDLILWGELK